MGQPLRVAIEGREDLDPELLKAAFEASSEGFALAEGGRICYANQAFAKLLNFENSSELQGRLLASFRPPGYPCALVGGVNTSRRSSTLTCASLPISIRTGSS